MSDSDFDYDALDDIGEGSTFSNSRPALAEENPAGRDLFGVSHGNPNEASGSSKRIDDDGDISGGGASDEPAVQVVCPSPSFMHIDVNETNTRENRRSVI